MFVINILVLVSLLGVGLRLNGVASMTHSLMYFDTSSTDVPNFPEFISVGYVNGLQISHYDSNTKKYEPKQEWMKRITEEDPQYWDRNTQINLNNEQSYKVSTETVKQRLNQTEGSHMWQRMYGCEWDDETDEINGWYQFAFDGEDFIALDLKTETFVAPRSEAVPTKHKWERVGEAVRLKDYVTHECVEYLKKHLRNGKSTVMRKELPVVSFLQKSPSAPVTCHATGFYPDRAMLFWTRDGEEWYEGVEPWEILPNHDGTFQMSVDLDLSSVPPEDWTRYECMFQLTGKPDMPTRLDPGLILTNAKKNPDYTAVAVPVALAILGAALLVAVGFAVYKWRKTKQLTPSSSEPDVKKELMEVTTLKVEAEQEKVEAEQEKEEAEQPLDPKPE